MTTEVKRVKYGYSKTGTRKVDIFLDSLEENSRGSNGVFDSAAAGDFISTAINQNTGIEVPQELAIVLDEAKPLGERDTEEKAKSRIVKAILDGAKDYEYEHGVNAPSDLVEYAMHLAYSTTDHAKSKFRGHFDSASSDHHDQLSLQPNRAIVAILSAMGDAIPFAHYLPADIGSNEGKLAILTHQAAGNQAGNAFGMYGLSASMDGVNAGDPYITSARVHSLTPAVSTGAIAGKLTTIQDTDGTCDQAAAAVKLLRGASIVYVNGLPVAKEVSDISGSGNSTVSGSVTLSGTTYAIGGTINTDTGVFAITTTPAMPDTVPVAVEGFIDWERDATMTPRLSSSVITYPLFARPWRAYTQVSPDSRTQMSNELGLDPYSEGIIAIQHQFSAERHYQVLAKAKRLGVSNQATFNYDWSNRKAYLNRTEAWRDFATALGAVSQQMAIDTFDHGVTHLYVGKHLAADLMSLPNDIFEPSGISERPGIFRLGRLYGRFEVYYTPKGLQDTASAAQILCVGRATSVALNPFVLGDAVAPFIRPLGINVDLKEGAGYYARCFTAVNPHLPSAKGCAIINVTNLGQ
jgi:hypothetical protein